MTGRNEAGLRRIGHRLERPRLIELVNAHPLQDGIGHRLPDIDETAPVLDPEAGHETLLGDHFAHRPRLHFLRHPVGKRHQRLANQENQQCQQTGNPKQGHQQVTRRQTGSAQHRDFRMAGQRGQRIERTDQGRNWNQLINQARQTERDIKHCLIKLVAVLADAAQFVDQVEEGKQRDEGKQHEKDRSEYLAHQVALVEIQAKHQEHLRCHGSCNAIRR